MDRLRRWARAYRPAQAKQIALAVLAVLSTAGVTLGDFPSVVDASLGLVALVCVVLGGKRARRRTRKGGHR